MPGHEHPRWNGPFLEARPAHCLLGGRQPARDEVACALGEWNEHAHGASLAEGPHTAVVRVLFTCRPLTGHFRPLLPLAHALRAVGHDVGFACADPVAAEAARDGFEVMRVGLGPESRLKLLERYPDVDTIPRERLRATFFSELFVGIELEPRARDLVEVVDAWQPDILVHEVAEFAAPLVAHLRGLPYVTHGFGAIVPEPVIQAAAGAATPIWQAFGLEPRTRAGLYEHLYVDVCPPSLQETDVAGVDRIQLLRTIDRAAASDRNAWVDRDDERPLVYVTLGTVWNHKTDVFGAIVDALADLELVAVVTVGTQNDPTGLGALPANVSAHRFIPQAELLPHCAAAIIHGGSGTILGALVEGVPLVLVPQGADQFTNAERAAAAGAGLEILPEAFSSARVRECLTAVLDDPAYRTEARRISDELVALPPPSVAVERIEQLVERSGV